jgi:hypothetical protein
LPLRSPNSEDPTPLAGAAFPQAAGARAVAQARQTASLEAETSCIAEQLRDVIKATRGNVEKKTTLSFQELEAERMEEEYDMPEDGEVRHSRCIPPRSALTMCAALFCRSPRTKPSTTR